MPHATILFKDPAVTVQRYPEKREDTAVAGSSAVLKVGTGSILLEAAAAELLVSYLQVIRAYFYSFPHSRKIIAGLYEQVAQHLHKTSQQSENPVITNRQVSDLIQQLGCIDDWEHQYLPVME